MRDWFVLDDDLTHLDTTARHSFIQHRALLADRFLDDYEWFAKIDDDSYFSPDNFRHLTSTLDPEEYHYLGHTQYHWGPNNLFNLGELSIIPMRRIVHST